MKVGGEEEKIDERIREHLDAVAEIQITDIQPMTQMTITEYGVRKQLKRLKEGKAPGLDGLKAEIFKTMLNSDVSVRALNQAYMVISEDGKDSSNCEKSKTTLQKQKEETNSKRP